MDVTNPTNPNEIGSYEVKGHSGQLVADGNVVYVADYDWGLRIFDITSLSDIKQAGFYSPLGYARDIAIDGRYAYVAAAYYGLRVVDISDLQHPVQVGMFDTPGYAISVAVNGNYVYLATMSPALPRGNAFYVVDVSNPAQPKEIWFYDFGGGPPRDMTVANGVAYIVNEWGLTLISLIDTLHPEKIGVIEIMDPTDPISSNPGSAIGIAVQGTYAYVIVSPGRGLNIIDVSNPSAPKLVGVCTDFSPPPYELAVADGFAYIADVYKGLEIVDVSDPVNPSIVASCDTAGTAVGIAVSENIAYICDAEKGVVGIDISKPLKPKQVKSYDTLGFTHKVRIVGNYAYLADGNGGMLVLETGINTNTESSYETPETPSILKVSLAQGAGTKQLAATSIEPLKTVDTVSAYSAEMAYNAVVSSLSGKTLTVTSAADSGSGTLRWCLESAVKGDTIIFDISEFPPNNPTTIFLDSGLKPIAQGNITLDASNAGVVIDGSKLSGNEGAFTIISDGNVLKGLFIKGFSTSALMSVITIIDGAKYNVIGGDRTRGSGPIGEGNIISGNKGIGIDINGVGTINNRIIGNYIGVDYSGKNALGNQGGGIRIAGASYNQIGGMAPGEGNIISANGLAGIGLIGREVNGNSVIGNYIGTDVSGTIGLGNGGNGITIECGAFNNLIQNNVISGNARGGLHIFDWGGSYNTVIGNLIGTDASGTFSIGNREFGVSVGYMGASFNRIGGVTLAERNIISGNNLGISLEGPRNIGNLVLGNFIGTDITGVSVLGNQQDGIDIFSGSDRIFIGGLTEGERNIVSGNGGDGIHITAGNDFNWIAGNLIGAGIKGIAIGNNQCGISVDNVNRNFIRANIIKANKRSGITLTKTVNCVIFSNELKNPQNGYDDSGYNSWNCGNIGNYWSDYKGKDVNGDGIGDTPYQISPNGIDRYPLMKPPN